MKKVLVISTSLRAHSNSHALAEAFAHGAADAGHEVELVSLRGKDIKFCIGCLSCTRSGKCVIKDDAAAINALMHDADIIAFATPIYYYEMSGQMKTMLDRANPLFGGDYRFTDIYLLSSAAENLPEVPARAINSIEGWIECFDRAHFAGSVFAGGVTDPDEIEHHPALLTAYQTGKKL